MCLGFSCTAQPGPQTVLGRTDSLRSTILHETRTFYVHVPAGAAGPGAATKRYPVVYLFDGDAQFAAATSMIQFLSTNYNTVCPEMIVVGILHPDRRKDLTPTHVTADPPYWPAGASRTTGGGRSLHRVPRTGIAALHRQKIPNPTPQNAHWPFSGGAGRDANFRAPHSLVQCLRLH